MKYLKKFKLFEISLGQGSAAPPVNFPCPSCGVEININDWVHNDSIEDEIECVGCGEKFRYGSDGDKYTTNTNKWKWS